MTSECVGIACEKSGTTGRRGGDDSVLVSLPGDVADDGWQQDRRQMS